MNQDLLAANEEILSSNEELQSLNEELETAKEELQSTNEELTTLNDELQSRNQELRLHNDDLKNLLGSVGIAIVMLDQNLRLRRYTREAVELFNLIPGDVGRPITDIRARIDIPDLESTLRGVMTSGRETTHELPDEHGRWVRVTTRPFMTSDDEVAGVVLAVLDVDAAHRYQSHLERASALSEALNAVGAVFDSRAGFMDSVVRAVRIACEALAATYAELVLLEEGRWVLRSEVRGGHSIEPNLPLTEEEASSRGLSASFGRSLVADLGTAGPAHITLAIMAEDDLLVGAIRFVWSQTPPSLGLPEVEFCEKLALKTDLACERSRRQFFANRLAEERTAALRETTDRLIEASHIKDEFLANMSHELRTPLNSIIGFSKIMLDGLAGSINPEQQKQLEMVLGAGNHLLAIITDVLDLEKIEAGAFPVAAERVAVSDVVGDVVALMRPLAEAKGLRIVDEAAESPLVVLTDPLKLRQILLNLVGNAVKFTDTGEVALSVDATDRTAFTVSVADTGRGMTPGECESVFRAFTQVASAEAAKPEGTGLGLAIARRLAVLLGGEIGVESAAGVGSTFRVTLPREIA